jgi:hypothetical protein
VLILGWLRADNFGQNTAKRGVGLQVLHSKELVVSDEWRAGRRESLWVSSRVNTERVCKALKEKGMCFALVQKEREKERMREEVREDERRAPGADAPKSSPWRPNMRKDSTDQAVCLLKCT